MTFTKYLSIEKKKYALQKRESKSSNRFKAYTHYFLLFIIFCLNKIFETL